jgi:hypothetical protein
MDTIGKLLIYTFFVYFSLSLCLLYQELFGKYGRSEQFKSILCSFCVATLSTFVTFLLIKKP